MFCLQTKVKKYIRKSKSIFSFLRDGWDSAKWHMYIIQQFDLVEENSLT